MTLKDTIQCRRNLRNARRDHPSLQTFLGSPTCHAEVFHRRRKPMGDGDTPFHRSYCASCATLFFRATLARPNSVPQHLCSPQRSIATADDFLPPSRPSRSSREGLISLEPVSRPVPPKPREIPNNSSSFLQKEQNSHRSTSTPEPAQALLLQSSGVLSCRSGKFRGAKSRIYRRKSLISPFSPRNLRLCAREFMALASPFSVQIPPKSPEIPHFPPNSASKIPAIYLPSSFGPMSHVSGCNNPLQPQPMMKT
jgi:hypothetical protein